MASLGARFEAAVLVLDEGKPPLSPLHPLTSPDLPTALLPVATQPLLSFALRRLDSCRVSGVTLVVAGKARGLQVSGWLAQEQEEEGVAPAGTQPLAASGPGSRGTLVREVLVVPDGFQSADALRALLSHRDSDASSLETATSESGAAGSAIRVSIWQETPALSSQAGTSTSDRGVVADAGSPFMASQRSADAGAGAAATGHAEGSTSQHLLVLDACTICDLKLGAVAAAHWQKGAAATVVLIPGHASGTADGAPRGGDGALSKDKAKGSKPRSEEGQDVIGLDAATGQRLLYFTPGWAGAKKGGALGVPRELLLQEGGLQLHAHIRDARNYAFSTSWLRSVLAAHPRFSCLRKDVLPWLMQQQRELQKSLSWLKMQSRLMAAGMPPVGAGVQSTGPGASPLHGTASGEAEGVGSQGAGQGLGQGSTPAGECYVYMAPAGTIWHQISSVHSFAEASHALLSSDAVHLLGQSLSAASNIIHPSVTWGAKSTVGAQCMVGTGTQLGDKCSVKRSLVGRHCRIGSSVKIADSVVMDYVTLENGCSLQNCLVSSHVVVKEGRVLKDSQVGAHVVVATDQASAQVVK